MHLLQAGVNLIYIRDLLGHVDLATTEIYARADTELKRQALEKVYPNLISSELPEWTEDQDLLDWLTRLSNIRRLSPSTPAAPRLALTRSYA